MRIIESINGTEFLVSGALLRISALKEEWDTEVSNPEKTAECLRRSSSRPDIFTFMQRLPHSAPRFFHYHREWDNVAAIPVTTYDNWLNNQLHRNPRNKLKKAQKLGLTTSVVPFSDELVAGIKEINDEVPIRQGHPYSHYGKSHQAVRAGYETYIDRSIFIAAHYDGKLVAFLKLVICDSFARTMGIIAKLQYRELAPMNALVSTGVQLCESLSIPFLVYGRYSYGKLGSDTLRDFKHYNGFEPILLPRYYIPLTSYGRVAINLGIHRGLKESLPRPLLRTLRSIRNLYFAYKHSFHKKLA